MGQDSICEEILKVNIGIVYVMKRNKKTSLLTYHRPNSLDSWKIDHWGYKLYGLVLSCEEKSQKRECKHEAMIGSSFKVIESLGSIIVKYDAGQYIHAKDKCM